MRTREIVVVVTVRNNVTKRSEKEYNRGEKQRKIIGCVFIATRSLLLESVGETRELRDRVRGTTSVDR